MRSDLGRLNIQMTQEILLTHLETDLRAVLEVVRTKFATLPMDALIRRNSPESWNILECFAHLNAYSDYYLSHIERCIHKAKARRWNPAPEFESTWFGRYSVNYVDPKHPKLRKRKTSKRFNFLNKPVADDEVKRFIINTERLLRYLQMAHSVDLNKPSVPVAQFKLLKLNLGDLLNFLVLHTERHVGQAINTQGV